MPTQAQWDELLARADKLVQRIEQLEQKWADNVQTDGDKPAVASAGNAQAPGELAWLGFVDSMAQKEQNAVEAAEEQRALAQEHRKFGLGLRERPVQTTDEQPTRRKLLSELKKTTMAAKAKASKFSRVPRLQTPYRSEQPQGSHPRIKREPGSSDVGRRVRVWWLRPGAPKKAQPKHLRAYIGVVVEQRGVSANGGLTHLVRYDDGDEQWTDVAWQEKEGTLEFV